MSRPSKFVINALTPGGIKFQWLLDNYTSTGAADANLDAAEALVSWADSDNFLKEAVGFTTWTLGLPTFLRTPPLAHPLRADLWCDKYDLTDFGSYEDRTDFSTGAPFFAPAQDWCIYKLSFIRPRYDIYRDVTLATFYGNLEQNRYCWVSYLPRPRERKVSGYGFEFDISPGGDGSGPWRVVPEERQFIPDWQADLTVTLEQVPEDAVPWDAIEAALNTVNATPIKFSRKGRTYVPGALLFKGLAEPLQVYFGANAEPYYRVKYKFTVQPGGWNKYLYRDPTTGAKSYKPINVRQAAGSPPAVPLIPPYLSTEYQALFQPAAAPI